VGNDPATGCAFGLGSVAPGSLAGFELQVTVVVDAELVPALVASAELETCDGGNFGDPQSLSGFALHLDSGLLGSDSVVGVIPRSLLGDATVVRLAHHALSSGGSEDALSTTNGTPDGAPITLALPELATVPVLSGLGIALAVLLLLAIGYSRWRSGRWRGAAGLVLILVASGAVIAYAGFAKPLAIDALADAHPPDSRAEIVVLRRGDGHSTEPATGHREHCLRTADADTDGN
jgi:hypothetical protein